MWSFKFALPAFLLESAALAALVGGSDDSWLLAAFLSLHAAASLIAAMMTTAVIPGRNDRLPLLVLIFGANYALPVVGFAATLLGVLILKRLPEVGPELPYRAVELPPVDPQQRASSGFRQSSLSAFLNNRNAPDNARLKALIALQAVPGRVSTPLLRGVLADPSEDIRLLAYGMLDNQEKRLNVEIHAARQQYQKAVDKQAARLEAAKRLSELYWELIYQSFAIGDLRQHAASEALRYTREAMSAERSDPALALRLGRLLHETGDTTGARAAYESALALGLPEPRIAPYLAELAFDRRDFGGVRQQLTKLRRWPSQPRLDSVVRYWATP